MRLIAYNELRIDLLKEMQNLRNEVHLEMRSLHSRFNRLAGEVKFIKDLCVFIAGVISTTSHLFGMIKFFLH